jgi:hypothetical protein
MGFFVGSGPGGGMFIVRIKTGWGFTTRDGWNYEGIEGL